MTTRERVLAALREAGDAGVNGPLLAEQLGVSRVAVSKHVAALRAEGYEIDAAPGSGYVLRALPHRPVPREVRRLLLATLWTELSGGGETDSTNDDARALARAGVGEGAVVLASRQLAGRGRLGRTWESPEGGAYLSAVLRPAVAPSEVSSLALVVALGVAEALETLGLAPSVKWPNDVLVDGAKLAGVLLEMAAEADRVDWVVVGVGINVLPPDDPADRVEGAAYVGDFIDSDVPQVTAALLDGIASAYVRWGADGFATVRDAYESRLALRGRSVCVSGLDGVVRAEGVVAGVDDGGRLLVVSDQGVTPVSAGEVTLRA